MDDQKLEYKLDHIDTKLCAIDITLGKQSVILDEHVKRTDTLQGMVNDHQEVMSGLNGVVKFFKFIGVLAGIVECIRLFFH